MIIERLITLTIAITITHIVMSLTIHNHYYNTLDTLLNIDTQRVHKHTHDTAIPIQ